jgi:hypothetical protein
MGVTGLQPFGGGIEENFGRVVVGSRADSLLPTKMGTATQSVKKSGDNQGGRLVRIIHECYREAFKTEASRGFSQVVSR